MRTIVTAMLVLVLAACGRNVPREESCNKFCVKEAVCMGGAPPADGGLDDPYVAACTNACLGAMAHYQLISLHCESLGQAAFDCDGDEATTCGELFSSTVVSTDHCYAQWGAADDECGPPPM